MAAEKDNDCPGMGAPTPEHAVGYPVSRLAPAFSLVDLAREIEQADRLVDVRAAAKLQVIADQIRALQEEARAVLAAARQDRALHRASCAFSRQPGQVYHLYEKPDGSRYFSMLSPADWQGAPPHPFHGSFRLEADMSWMPLDRAAPADDSCRRRRHLLDEDA